MENGVTNGHLLSSWKEIAAYLKCTVRSCIRWEKERGLPVHRSADAPGARVYAFKPELDDWLRQQALHPTIPPRGRKPLSSGAKAVMFALPALAAGIAAFLVLRPDGPRSHAVPHDSFSIITSQVGGAGTLRTWQAAKPDDYAKTWEVNSSPTNTVRHTTIASGDLDGDGRPELAAPTAFRRTYYQGEDKSLYYCIFVNTYKEGVEGIWKTTFYSTEDLVWETSDHARNEVLLDNIDQNPAAEIILKTATALAVLRYDPSVGKIRLTHQAYGLLKDKRLLLRSVTTAKRGAWAPKLLIVSANERGPATGGPDLGAGWILFIEVWDKGIEVVKSVPVDAGLCDYSLRTGDLSGGGDVGIFSTAVRKTGDAYGSYLLGWDLAGKKTVDIPLPGPPGAAPPRSILGISDITFDRGDDILVGLEPKRLLLYSQEGGALTLKADRELEMPGAFVNAFGFGDVDEDKYLEIVVGGGISAGDKAGGRYYLEVLGYRTGTSEFFSKWKTVGSEEADREATWVTVSRGAPRRRN